MRVRWAGWPVQRGFSAAAGSPAWSVFAAVAAQGWMETARWSGRRAATQKTKEPKEFVQKTLDLQLKPVGA